MKERIQPVNPSVIPLAGIGIFLVLYVVAAHFYPGGSDADRFHRGFDWLNNYWCDLIAKNGKNGIPNAARPIALTAMIILFSSLSVFWFRLPDFFHENRFTRLLIGYTGLFAMTMLIFVFTKQHDIVIFIGGSVSSISFAGTLKELYTNRWHSLFRLGCFCLVLILLNFYSYLSGWLIFLLPLIQKVTLLFFLGWVFLVNRKCLFLSGYRSRNRLSKTDKGQLPV